MGIKSAPYPNRVCWKGCGALSFLGRVTEDLMAKKHGGKKHEKKMEGKKK